MADRKKKKKRVVLGITDRSKFFGLWRQGAYRCLKSEAVEDSLRIEKGVGMLGVIVTIHAEFVNPDRVKGRLVSKNTIEIPEQTMGNMPGSARIVMGPDGVLTYWQRGLGIECLGEGYKKQ